MRDHRRPTRLRVLTCAPFCALLCALLCPGDEAGSPPQNRDEPLTPGSGEVLLPLSEYTELLREAGDPSLPPRPAPAGYALGNARVNVAVDATGSATAASIQVNLSLDVLEEDWVLVPVLPAGTPVGSATVNGKPVQLIPTADGLAWGTRRPGSFSMQLVYKVDARRSEGGFTLTVPLPRAAAITLTATLPGTDLDASVIPAAGTRSVRNGQATVVTATVPTSSGVQISWRVPTDLGHTISRARYEGELTGEAIVWTGVLSVELFDNDSITLPLLPRSTTLSGLQVDGDQASILVEGDRFATLVKGKGLHEVTVVFQTPIRRGEGPPQVDFRIPQIPVSRFELTLPGKKDLTVTPQANVTSEVADDATVSIVHVPMTDRLSFSWSEAIPEEIRAEIRANAATYHTIYADEGVLFVRALVAFEITRGETNVIDLSLPDEVQINRIDSESGAVADWRVAIDDEGSRVVSVFLDRQLRGKLLLDVEYDLSLKPNPADAALGFDLPLIHPVVAQRQKGMVALLASSELTLSPLETDAATKVGEDQLPAFVRDTVEMTIAHTYKYTEHLPRIVVETTTPERVQGKFDAQVDTLISLGDVTLSGTAAIEINVKSGRIMDLELGLPDGVSLLNLTAPSLRTHRVVEGTQPRRVALEFTQEMEGQFRLDLNYERILVDGADQVPVPTVTVLGAEVEQGRIAIEALSAVEVQPATAEQLSQLDINELPQQLVLRTTNPILLAYKYVHADPPHRLALEVTRHEVLGVQEAAIDRADYKTLFTTDGLLVTTAEYTVRNTSKQFLRIRLPQGSDVWSTFVDGKPEKPALAEVDDEGRQDVLVKIINSTRPFGVQLIYATTGNTIGKLGTIDGALPNPDILVTHSHWDVFLPDELGYGAPSTNMDLVQDRERVSRDAMSGELTGIEEAATARDAIQPLRITVPASGIHYAFEKLYANQSGLPAWFELPYASTGGAALGHSMSLLGVLAFWCGIGLYLSKAKEARRPVVLALSLAGLAILFVSLGVYELSATTPLVVSLIVALGAGAWYLRRYWPGPQPLSPYQG